MAKFRYLIAICLSGLAWALPGDADRLIPILQNEIRTYWPSQIPKEWIPALIEQESLWKSKAKLRTDREFGCGLGQFTVAYNKDGSVRFDALTETKGLDPALKEWSWRDCYNEQLQLRAVVLKLRSNDRSCEKLMIDRRNINACSAAAYNGGFGSVLKRIRSCPLTPGCNKRVWFDSLNTICAQSNVKAHGYGESFCQINSKYPSRIEARMPKYKGI